MKNDELKDSWRNVMNTLNECQDRIDTIHRLTRYGDENSYGVFLAGDEACRLQNLASRLMEELRVYRFEKYGD